MFHNHCLIPKNVHGWLLILISILGPHEIDKGLGLLVLLVVMGVRVVGRADVLHAVDAAAFGAASKGAFAIHLFFLGIKFDFLT